MVEVEKDHVMVRIDFLEVSDKTYQLQGDARLDI